MTSSDSDDGFSARVKKNIADLGNRPDLKKQAFDWMVAAGSCDYAYNFSWLGRPIIQYPQDMVGIQELIWDIKPDLIIETGIAHGGSLIFSASMLALMDYCEAQQNGSNLDPAQPKRLVVGVDIDIRDHNRQAIEAHPMSPGIKMIEGSSVDPTIIEQVREIASNYNRVLVCLDSNHTHKHVLEELRAYAPLVTRDSYCVVFDTVIEDCEPEMFVDRPWGPGNSPRTAVESFLSENTCFKSNKEIESKLLITVSAGGFLKRIA